MQASAATARPAGAIALRARAVPAARNLCIAPRSAVLCPARAPALRRCPVVQASLKPVQPELEDEVVPSSNGVKKVFGNLLKLGTAVGIALTLALSTPDVAEAARSGGRIGGSRGFSTARSMGGMGGSLGGSAMRSSASRSAFAPSAVSSAPSVVVMPSSPFGGYGYGGFGWGFGRPMIAPMFGFMSILQIMVMAMVAVTAIQMFQGLFGGDEAGDEDPIQIATVQVGLLGLARGLQDDLDQMADTIDFDSPEGLHTLLQETTLALMRNPDYCVYGTSTLGGTDNYDDAEDMFNEASMSERSKFKSETLVSVAGRAGVKKAEGDGRGDAGLNEMIVVTLIVAAESRLDIPEVNSLPTLKTALSKIGGLRPDGILAAEVLWTPQEKGDFLTKDEVMMDYPGMNLL